MHDRIDAVAARIAAATRLTILTGAGVSAASGVPTFRGQDGLWKQYRAEDLATPEAFRRNPNLVGVVRVAPGEDRRLPAERGA